MDELAVATQKQFGSCCWATLAGVSKQMIETLVKRANCFQLCRIDTVIIISLCLVSCQKPSTMASPAGRAESIGNQERTPDTRRLGVLCRGRTNRGLVPPPLPPHCCASRAGAADSLTAFRVLLFDSAIRCEWGRHSLSQRAASASWSDWTNRAHHQPLVHERRLASVCALFVLWKALAIRPLAQSDAC
jgi:hypothetical protein